MSVRFARYVSSVLTAMMSNTINYSKSTQLCIANFRSVRKLWLSLSNHMGVRSVGILMVKSSIFWERGWRV